MLTERLVLRGAADVMHHISNYKKRCRVPKNLRLLQLADSKINPKVLL